MTENIGYSFVPSDIIRTIIDYLWYDIHVELMMGLNCKIFVNDDVGFIRWFIQMRSGQFAFDAIKGYFWRSCEMGSFNICKELVPNFVKLSPYDYIYGLWKVYSNGYLNIIEYLREQGGSELLNGMSINDMNVILKSACGSNKVQVVKNACELFSKYNLFSGFHCCLPLFDMIEMSLRFDNVEMFKYLTNNLWDNGDIRNGIDGFAVVKLIMSSYNLEIMKHLTNTLLKHKKLEHNPTCAMIKYIKFPSHSNMFKSNNEKQLKYVFKVMNWFTDEYLAGIEDRKMLIYMMHSVYNREMHHLYRYLEKRFKVTARDINS